MGYYTLSTAAYPIPENTDVIILDAHDPLTFTDFYSASGYTRLQKLFLSRRWKITESLDGFMAFRSVPGEPGLPNPPCFPVETAPNPVPAPANWPADICLAGFETGTPDEQGRLPVRLFWRKVTAGTNDYGCVLSLFADNQLVCRTTLYPGSRIWPPQSWPAGSLMRDEHYVVLSQNPSGRFVRPSISLFPIP